MPSYISNDATIVGGIGSGEIEPAGNSPHTKRSSLGLDGPSVFIMTGPNYSGKSIYLKQVALIVYMAHVGCFVPAEQATVGLTDKILTRISTRETVSRTQSAFMIDLQQISCAMRLATRRSLLVIDEFGKGTDASGMSRTESRKKIPLIFIDGAGLMCGILKHFLELGDERPKVLAATHFHEIFENNFLPPSHLLDFGYMQVRVDERASVVEDQVVYLYK